MKTTAIIKTRQQTATLSGIDKISMASIAAMGGISAAIGIWAVMCFAVTFLSNGPLAMLKGAISALTGI